MSSLLWFFAVVSVVRALRRLARRFLRVQSPLPAQAMGDHCVFVFCGSLAPSPKAALPGQPAGAALLLPGLPAAGRVGRRTLSGMSGRLIHACGDVWLKVV